MAQLLDFGQDTDSFVWMAEAIDTGMVKAGEELEIQTIAKTTSGTGYIIECRKGAELIYDYAWSKGKTGQVIQSMFTDPSVADDNHLFCKAQNKVKNAVLVAKQTEGVEWVVSMVGDKEVLRVNLPVKGLVSLPKQKTSKSPAELSQSSDTSMAS